MVTPKERKLLTNLRGIKGRKIWVLCCRRSQSEEDMVLELFLHADRSMCLKFVCLAGGILEMRSLLLSSQLCISLLLLFPSWEAVFSLPQLSVTLQFPTLPFSLPLALFVHPWWKPFLLACVRAVPMLFPVGVPSIAFPPLPDICRFALVYFPPVSQGYSVNRSPDKTARFHSL